jgi:U4/U6 small nuclear ribonucleoprotein PRP4
MGGFELVASQVGGERPISSCSFSPDVGVFATGDFGGVCRIWSTEDCNIIRELEGVHSSRIGNVVFNPMSNTNGTLASCDNEGKIALWSLSQEKPVGELKGHTGRVSQVAFHPSGRLLGSASFDHSWRLWDVERQCELQLQEGHSRHVYSVAFHPDGALAATGALDSHGRIWDLRLGRAIWTLQGHIKAILSLDFHPLLPIIATGSEDGTVRIWDLRKLLPVNVLPAQSSVVSCTKWRNEVLLTAGFDGTARLWGADLKSLITLSGHESKVLDAEMSRDASKVLTVSADRTIKLWKCPNAMLL